MSLPESLERAASEMAGLADKIRPANGDPHRLLDDLEANEAAQLLVFILQEDPDGAADLIEVWSEADAGAAILSQVSDEGVSKAGRKLLRRARHRLRSQGVEVAEQPATSTASSAGTRHVGGRPDRFQAAHVSALDFRGARVGYLVDSHPSGGARLFEVRFDEARGILDFKIYNAGRSKVRGFLKSLTGGSEQRLFDVDRDALRALIRRASLSQPADRPLPTAFVEWRSRLFSDEIEKAPTPGDLVREALATPTDASSDESERALDACLAEIRAGSLGPWPPQTTWVGEWISNGRESIESLSSEARADAIESWLGEVTNSLIEQTDATLLGHRLEETAWTRWQSDAEAGARALLVVAESMATGDEVMKRLSRARVEGLFAPFLAELRVVEEDALDAGAQE